MDGDADQLERAVAHGKAELAAEVQRLRARAARLRRSAMRRSVGARSQPPRRPPPSGSGAAITR